METSILIDWISITDTQQSEKETSSHHSLHDGLWKEVGAKLGYTLGQKHGTGVTEYVNYTRSDMGRHVIYSGKAMQRMKFEKNISPRDILIHHIKEGHHVARLDLAIDFKGYGDGVKDYIRAFELGRVKTKLRKATVVRALNEAGTTLYIGSMKKRKNLIRVYDKGAETGTGIDWLRVELQIMGKKATSTGRNIAASENIKKTIIGIIKGVVDFPTVGAWKALTNDISLIQMNTLPKQQGDTELWLMKQVIPALGRTIVLNSDFWIQFKLALLDNVPDEYSDIIKDGNSF